jgi:hypothetical protein
MFSQKPRAKKAQMKIIELYEFTLNYVKRLRADLIDSSKSCEERTDVAKERVKTLKDQNDSKTKLGKALKEIEELKETNETLKKENEVLTFEGKKKDETIKSLKKTRDDEFVRQCISNELQSPYKLDDKGRVIVEYIYKGKK